MRDQLQASLKAGWMINIVLNLSFILFAIGTAASFGVSAYLFRRETITIGTVYLVYHYTRMLERPLQTITRQLQDLQRAGAGVARVQALFAAQSDLSDVAPSAARTLPNGALGVAFHDVTFSYKDDLRAAPEQVPSTAAAPAATAGSDGDGGDPHGGPSSGAVPRETILHDLTFDIAPGTVLGLLGRTGSGKTTLTRLILRFYDPDTGTVALEAGTPGEPVDIRQVPIRALRRHVGVVTQEIQLFSASVRDNLTLFEPEIPDDAIVDVLDSLGLGPWLEDLPDGLDTSLGDDQGGLSAGEAQLLAFARIFLHNPGLVLLDEASSRLDPATEHLIERAVDRLVEGRTAIIIAHRLGTVERADEIMILEDGHILEHGSRVALAHDPGSHFYHLLQTGLEEVMA
jgi:ABC-type multidrug transport system fused ATPase/permease subunit